MREWTVDADEKLTFDDVEITELNVRIVGGAVNVVPTDGPARLEVTEIVGPPLIVRQDGRRLTVTYQDLTWGGIGKWLENFGWSQHNRRHAVVSVAVPRKAAAMVGVVTGDATVGGLQGPVSVNGVSGELTINQLANRVDAHTVSGRITARAVTGDLSCNTVSGDVTVFEGGGSVKAHSVSGVLTIDVADPGTTPVDQRPTRIELNSVSGEIAVRLPHPTDASVEAQSTGGRVASAFDELRMSGGFGLKKLTGRLGEGRGKLVANSVSGSITLLKRPVEDGPDDDAVEGKVL
ncbi:hypothetical protein BIV57_21090 [Mangrovactinospora gilvigrisea]|uniref:DUF4097 domain-containing protein n=1 Tax=Mangrovactinospora gilvigrisea TaxID=1428644 RepID=A0A1J7C1Q3_9ACTN|nr:DUF4097 family beta strand repeat-containing protein [Mangrovactinospora gilvigrisea]OIV35496.1 hypothetical protein BIV57_21090 [Mangrovactinospora gilvigrisea]